MTDNRSPLGAYAPDRVLTRGAGPGVPQPEEQTRQITDIPSLLWAHRTLSRTERFDGARERMRDKYRPLVDRINADMPWYGMMFNPATMPDSDAQEKLIFQYLDQRRKTQPDFAMDIAKDPADLEARFQKQDVANRETARIIQSRESGFVQKAIGLGADLYETGIDPVLKGDPATIATYAFGGVGGTAARRVVAQMAAGGIATALSQPFAARNRAQVGETLTAGEAATNIATGAAFGGVLQGVGEVAAPLLRKAVGAAKLAASARAAVPDGARTPGEMNALRAMDREADVAATSPFRPGAGTDAHVDRVNRTATAMANGARIPINDPPRTPALDLTDYLNRMAVKESGGKWDIQAKGSSAYGLYQLTRGTFLHYARELPGNRGLGDDAVWGRRVNPAMQEAVMNRLVVDQRRALARGGVPETYGNLYLMHFAGEGDGMRILKAKPGTPIEQAMSEGAIRANPFLKGKTTGEVVAWAHHAMNDPRADLPTVRRDLFPEDDGGDVEWAAAQREADAAEADFARTRAERADAEAPSWAVADEDVAFEPSRSRTDDSQPVAFEDDPIPGFDDDGYMSPPRDADPFGDISDEAEWRGPREAASDDAPIVAAARREGQPVAATMTEVEARDLERQGLGPASELTFQPREGEPGVSVRNEDGHFATAVYRDETGAARGVVRMPTSAEGREMLSGVSSYVHPDHRRQGIATRLYDSLRDEGYDVDALSGTDDLTPDGAAFVTARRASAAETRAMVDRHLDAVGTESLRAAEPAEAPPPMQGYDRMGDAGIETQIGSMEHDLRMAVEADPNLTVQLDEHDGPQRLADVLAELDADDAAVAAARACLAPMAEAAA